MASDPVRLNILKNVQATLRAMSDSSVYHFPVANPEQVTLDPTTQILTKGFPDLPFYMIEPTPDGDREFYQAEQIVENLRLNIVGRYDADSDDPLSKAETWERMAADLETALEADMTRGGYACDTRCLTPQPFTGVGSNIVIVLQPVVIKIYRQYGRP